MFWNLLSQYLEDVGTSWKIMSPLTDSYRIIVI